MTAAAWVPEGADIAELRKAAADCRGCELWESATQVVFSAGDPRARMALVGEQPGDEEDRSIAAKALLGGRSSDAAVVADLRVAATAVAID